MTLVVIAPFPLFHPRPCGGEHSFLHACHFLRAIERMTSLAERWYLVKLRTPLGKLLLRHHHQSRSWVGTQQAPNQNLIRPTAKISDQNVRPNFEEFLLLPSILIIREIFRFLFLISPDTRIARAQHVTNENVSRLPAHTYS